MLLKVAPVLLLADYSAPLELPGFCGHSPLIHADSWGDLRSLAYRSSPGQASRRAA